MLENKTAVIFDLDGTMADSMTVWTEIDRKREKLQCLILCRKISKV